MTDTNPRDLIKLLIDALKEECNWIDNPKHDELIAKVHTYLAQPEPGVSADEELNSKPSPNNLQIRSSVITPPPELVQQWRRSGPADAAVNNAYECHIATCAAQWGADQELEACCEWLEQQTLCGHRDLIPSLRVARRPKPPSLKEQALEQLDGIAAVFRMSHGGNLVCDTIRRALEQLND